MRPKFASQAADFLDGLVSHYVLDDGRLVVAHAGMKEEMQGRGSGRVREFALYGETTGETDEFGLPVRYNWAAEYRGRATVVYGHTPVPEPQWLNRTTNIDTGCVFGGKLTALRWPEREFVSVAAARTYCEPARPFLPEEPDASALTSQQAHDDLLDAEDVLGKRIISTRLRERDDPRGERHGGAGGDEPVRRQSQVAHLSAAHDVAVRDERPGRFSGASDRGVFVLSLAGRVAGRLRREAHGFAGRRDRLPGRRGGSAAFWNRRRNRASSQPGPVGGSSPTMRWRRNFSPGFARRWTPPTSGQFNTDWACLDCELMPWSVILAGLLCIQAPMTEPVARYLTPPEIATRVPHESLQAGDSCPKCEEGTVYELKQPECCWLQCRAGW